MMTADRRKKLCALIGEGVCVRVGLFFVGCVWCLSGRELCAVKWLSSTAKGGTSPGRDLSLYDIYQYRFDAKNLKGFTRSPQSVKLLYIGQYAGGAISKAIFENEERTKAVEEFLKCGGVLFFDYASYSDGATVKFLQSLGLEHPGYTRGRYYDCVPQKGSTHPVLRIPHHLRGKVGRAYGWWEGWKGKGYQVPFRDKENPDHAGMLIKTDVLGKGTIIFNQIYTMFREDPDSKKLVENVLTYIFSSLPAPGQRVAVWDPFEVRSPRANFLFLNGARSVRWHHTSPLRIPVVIAEPVGLARRQAIVRFVMQVPEGTKSLSFFTSWGKLLPCQWRVLRKGQVRCTLLLDLQAYETRLLFAYFGGKEPEQSGSDAFVLRRTPRGYFLRNDKLKVLLYPDKPMIGLIKPAGSDVRNELSTRGEGDLGRGNHCEGFGGPFVVSIVEDGRLAKSVRYAAEGYSVTYTLFRGQPLLFYSITSEKPRSTRRVTGWIPYGDAIRDIIFYETDEGLKKVRLITGTFYRPYSNLKRYMKEGWIAIEDERGEMVGEFTDLDSISHITFYHHMIYGNTLMLSTRIKGEVHGAFLATRGDHSTLRRYYIPWKNPPTVMIGRAQKGGEFHQPAPPRLGEKFILMHGSTG